LLRPPILHIGLGKDEGGKLEDPLAAKPRNPFYSEKFVEGMKRIKEQEAQRERDMHKRQREEGDGEVPATAVPLLGGASAEEVVPPKPKKAKLELTEEGIIAFLVANPDLDAVQVMQRMKGQFARWVPCAASMPAISPSYLQ